MPQIHVFHGTTPAPKKRDVVLYRAVIRLQLEFSSVTFDPAFDSYYISSRLQQPLGMARPHVWPPRLAGNADKDAQILALSKLKLLLDLGTTLPDDTPPKMKKATYKQFLTIDPELVTTAQADAYARIFIEAGVNEDGDPHHSSTVESRGMLPPGLKGDVVLESSDGNTDVELFWKNLVRADLIERIAALR